MASAIHDEKQPEPQHRQARTRQTCHPFLFYGQDRSICRMYVHLLIESRSSDYVHEVQNLHPRLSAHSSPYWSLMHPSATPTRSCKKVSRGSSNSSSAGLTHNTTQRP
jgi:hypothetical protein